MTDISQLISFFLPYSIFLFFCLAFGREEKKKKNLILPDLLSVPLLPPGISFLFVSARHLSLAKKKIPKKNTHPQKGRETKPPQKPKSIIPIQKPKP